MDGEIGVFGRVLTRPLIEGVRLPAASLARLSLAEC